MTKVRDAAHTIAFIDDYCAHYRGLFANVRHFEQFSALHHFLANTEWSVEDLRAERLELLRSALGGRPFVLCIDETSDRKDGTQTAHVAPQYLGALGKIANGIVAVNSLWADAQVYYPLHVRPYTPASRLPAGKTDPAFRTKPQLAAELVAAARAAGTAFRAVVADSLYGEKREFERALAETGVPYVLALKPSHGVWAPEAETHTPQEAAAQLRWTDADHPGEWTAVERRFRDGHEETWWAADLRLRGYGPEQATRLVVATTDPARLPLNSTWYLVTNLPLPDGAPTSAADAAPCPRRIWPRSYGCTGHANGSSKVTSRSSRNWAGLISRSARITRSGATGPWSAVRSPSAGGPNSIQCPQQGRPPSQPLALPPRCAPRCLSPPPRSLWRQEWGKNGGQMDAALPSWPVALRRVHS